MELGDGGFLHWQVIVGLSKKCSLITIKNIFGPYHAELTRSSSAEEYVFKEATRVAGTQFELGSRPFKRNSATDWVQVWDLAKAGKLMDIEADLRIRYYRTLLCIAGDYSEAPSILRTCHVFWGVTGSGKSRRAWAEAGVSAYSKDPRSKFWCGYRAQEHVVIDEFRGGIDLSHLLRWLDRYPVNVEIKGGSKPLMASTIWITSNLHPNDWYPDTDHLTNAALMRRLTIIEFT